MIFQGAMLISQPGAAGIAALAGGPQGLLSASPQTAMASPVAGALQHPGSPALIAPQFFAPTPVPFMPYQPAGKTRQACSFIFHGHVRVHVHACICSTLLNCQYHTCTLYLYNYGFCAFTFQATEVVFTTQKRWRKHCQDRVFFAHEFILG